MKTAIAKLPVIGAVALMTAACVGIQEHRGAVLDSELIEAVQPGVDNKESVLRTLGAPSFESQFNKNEWYYVARDTKRVAFRDPGVLSQTVLRVRFDDAGNVARIDRSGKELIASIDPSKAKTPTLGRNKSFFDELFGNIGTISQPGLPGSGQQR